jgi:diguanylate cyclase (GGDEF)-like protein
VRTKSGQFLPVRLQTAPLRDDHGSVQGAVEVFEEMPSAANRERRQSKLAGHGCIDGLTALLNHSMIQAHLRESLNPYLVYPVPFSVICFSVDGLQQLRERFGKAVDAVLKVVAQTLESGLRPTDFIGRWLDEEFLAILTECEDTEAMSVGDRLRKMAHQATIVWWGEKLRVTVSVGATVARPRHREFDGGPRRERSRGERGSGWKSGGGGCSLKYGENLRVIEACSS